MEEEELVVATPPGDRKLRWRSGRPLAELLLNSDGKGGAARPDNLGHACIIWFVAEQVASRGLQHGSTRLLRNYLGANVPIL